MELMTADVPGGVMYGIPPTELPEVLALLHKGVAFASTNQVPLSGALLARIRDLEAVVEAMRPRSQPEPLHVQPVARPEPLHPRKMDDMGGVVVSPAAACRILGVSRQRVNRRLLDGSLPGWQDESRRWHIRVSDLEGARAKGA